MSTFRPIRRKDVAPKALNIGLFAEMPPRLLIKDKQWWYNALADKDRPTKGLRTIAAFFLDRAAETVKDGRAASQALRRDGALAARAVIG